MWTLRKKYPQIESVLVLAYPGRAVSAEHYDRTMYPEIEGGPMRFAITRRNRRLVDNSDVLIAYVILDSGGAAVIRRYATRKNKRVINNKEGDTNGDRV